MALGTFSDLKASIQSWMFDRQDLAPLCDDFVAMCEADMNRVLRTREQLTTAILTPDVEGNATIPDDYLEFRNVVAQTSPLRVLSLVAPSWRDQADSYRISGIPKYFSISGGEMTVLPLNASPVELEYFARIPALSEDNISNWLLDRLPNAYLYGSLKHAAIFIGQTDRAATFGGLFNGLIDALVSDDRRGMYARVGARINGVTP